MVFFNNKKLDKLCVDIRANPLADRSGDIESTDTRSWHHNKWFARIRNVGNGSGAVYLQSAANGGRRGMTGN